jgi:ornithine decarboxylase
VTTAHAPSALYDFIHAPEPDPNFIARPTPYTVFSVDSAMGAYGDLVRALPLEVLYAVKASPVPALISALNLRGSGFDVASVPEVDLCTAAGADPQQLCYGNPIRSLEEVRQAADRGVRTWVVDTDLEVQRLAEIAPGSRIVIRLAADGTGSDWPLSLRFGTSPAHARQLAQLADRRGLEVASLSWHVGSLQRNVHAWDQPVATAADVWHALARDGIDLQTLNLGGGLPGPGYRHPGPALDQFATAILAAVDRSFPEGRPRLVAEPGRSLTAAAGASVVTVKAVVERTDGLTYVFTDGLVFNLGLIEGMDGSVEYRVTAPDHADDEPQMEVELHGQSCDSADQLKARTPYTVPVSLSAGDRLVIWDNGAYVTYASHAFNGYSPATQVVL